ncbi:MGMT family protein [Brucepastera parasyntrophica]|uniref:MGMT family protein n=1 Tax=Brucepastera parasyntrophica TaxID=2880008 RepID=UPI00210A5CD8|nr:MGMT family protein [Brucepastera parasyntrophica]ULQ60535.1 MGMT family protein [Brucepastera parasyntrophica]
MLGVTEYTARIIDAIKAVPPGKVSTYRNIALCAGMPNGARQVVRVLHSMSSLHNLPWHRIIKSDGRVALPAGYGKEMQIALLRDEGVAVTDDGKIDLDMYGFHA